MCVSCGSKIMMFGGKGVLLPCNTGLAKIKINNMHNNLIFLWGVSTFTSILQIWVHSFRITLVYIEVSHFASPFCLMRLRLNITPFCLCYILLVLSVLWGFN
jgi:hypothetical protein